MATEQSIWSTAKNFFSFSPQKAAPASAPPDRKELSSQVVEVKRIAPVKTLNADQTYLYEFGSLNMP